MSNSSLGQTYANVIEETIKTSQQDFIDAGISLDYLDALQEIWRSRLSNSNVSSFPWQSSSFADHAVPHEPLPQDIKPIPPTQQEPYHHNPAMAALRAMQQVQHHAAAQPEASNGAAQVVNQLAAIARQQDERFKQEQELRRQREEEERQRLEIKKEDDLFGDDDLEYSSSYPGSKRRLSQVESPEESNRPAPTYIAGSLLSSSPPVDIDSDIDAPHDTDSPRPSYLDTTLHSEPTTHKKPRRGIDPQDDAINSDLDDSDIESELDSELGEREDGDDGGADKSIVLCMYEKVNRTKNKWKCQLKDGVVSIGGKSWVFSKAHGEFEW